MGNAVVGNIVAVVQESVTKETAWATHGGGRRDAIDDDTDTAPRDTCTNGRIITRTRR
jgi:hypothetical protein